MKLLTFCGRQPNSSNWLSNWYVHNFTRSTRHSSLLSFYNPMPFSQIFEGLCFNCFSFASSTRKLPSNSRCSSASIRQMNCLRQSQQVWTFSLSITKFSNRFITKANKIYPQTNHSLVRKNFFILRQICQQKCHPFQSKIMKSYPSMSTYTSEIFWTNATKTANSTSQAYPTT